MALIYNFYAVNGQVNWPAASSRGSAALRGPADLAGPGREPSYNRRLRYWLLPWLIIATTIGACATAPAQKGEANQAGADRLAALEQRLMTTKHFCFSASVEATGALSSEFDGIVTVDPEGGTKVAFSGEFDGAPKQPWLREHQGTIVGGADFAAEPGFAGISSAGLRSALVIGFTRMGVLHNLARLSSSSPPDHLEGINTWLQAGDVQLGDEQKLGTGVAVPLTFDVIVAGKVSGRATLWLDSASGLPRQREQTVRFGDETMDVIETYTAFSLDDPSDCGAAKE